MKYVFASLLILLFFSCDSNYTKQTKLSHLIPENTSVVLKTSNLGNLRSNFKNNDLIEALSENKNTKSSFKHLEFLKHLNTDNPVLICFSSNPKDSLGVTLITKNTPTLIKFDSLTKHKDEVLKTKNRTIHKTTVEDQIFYSTIIDSILFASNSKETVELATPKPITDLEFQKALNASSNDKTVSAIFTSNKQFPTIFQSEELSKAKLSDYLMVDLTMSQDDVNLNGITKALDSTKSLINIFKNTIPQENKISHVCPPGTEAFLSFTFNNYKTFHEQLELFSKRDSITIQNPLFENINEVGAIDENGSKAIFLNSIDPTSTLEHLKENTLVETYRNISIYTFGQPDVFKKEFYPLITFDTASNFINLDDYFVFSDSIELLKEFIANYQNDHTLSSESYYQNLTTQLSDESSLLLYGNNKALLSVLKQNFSEDLAIDADNYKASALQFIYDTDFAHVNAVIKKHKAKQSSNDISEEFTITLDNDLLTTPQFITNHITKQKDIVVQDIKNNLYLISNEGKIYWKKQLQAKILGKIEQIDMYKNGRLQLAFATPNRIYVIARNGKDVSPFPLNFKDKITQPLSVFDYDKKKNYRLMVTQGKEVLMYDQKGKTVNGFTFNKAKNTISSQPQHFRIGRKDYIVFAEGTTLKILDRVGKTRIKVNDAINFSDNSIYLYEDKFTTTSTNGALVQVNQSGKMNSANLNLNESHKIDATSKTFVTLSENKLNIKSHPIELDYGEYTAPKIFYVNDKIYVSVTDLQSKKVYLFDSQGKAIPNFPIYGNSAIDLDSIDKDKNVEIVTKGDSNSLIIYKIN
ncbi:DUF3352 domain-containing protein [Mangrovimonas xylaniphaga]|uniref:DUF3352 domain-containing protein n=1 Tax=Mangrovimonas xylaniphaga TaxID=1645915 RepID=UPI0006B5C408|nr:DUF3352 domain-containing protein [Mangrovimonas xylaniphaga]